VIKDLRYLADAGELVGYFGYGSLVNRATLRTEIVAAFPARLNGWRRTWRPQPVMAHAAVPGADPAIGGGAGNAFTPALLTAHRAPQAAIDGLLVIDLRVNLPAVDARERHYHRRDIGPGDLEFYGSAPDIGCALHVYEARNELPSAEGATPILRSYLDAVMQGFCTEFGEDGLMRFVAETDDFHTPIHEDRHAPLYPRSVQLSAREIDLFDAALGQRPIGQFMRGQVLSDD
jgi:hypothetical protein